jgi:hypothetical protein
MRLIHCAKPCQSRLSSPKFQLNREAEEEGAGSEQQQQKKRKVGRRPHIQLLQQHVNTHNRHFRRRNNRPHNRRHVRQSRPLGIVTLRGYARRNSRSRSSPRQGNNSHTHQSPRSRRFRSQNARSRRPSRYTSPREIRLPHRTHRRSHADSPRWHQKTRRQTRKTRIASTFPVY